MNANVAQVAISCFGDANDAARELNLSQHLRERVLGIHRSERLVRPYSPPFSLALADLRKALAAGDLPAAVKATESVASCFTSVMNDWARALELSQAILDAFGKSNDK